MKSIRAFVLTIALLPFSAFAQAPATIPAAKTVTLHLHGVSADRALAEIEKQTGYAFHPGPAAKSMLAGSRVDLDVSGLPFWEVMAQLLDPLNLRPEKIVKDPPAMNVTANAPTWKLPFFIVSGPVAISLVEVRRAAHIDYGTQQRIGRENVTLAFEIYPEPSLPVMSLVSINIKRCVDDTGFPIAASEVQGSRPITFPERQPVQLAPLGGKMIAEIEGEVVLRMIGATHRVEIDKPLTVHAAQLPVTPGQAFVQACRKLGERQYQLEVMMPHDAAGAPVAESVRDCVVNSNPILNDAGGAQYTVERSMAQRDKNNDTIARFTLSHPAADAATEPVRLTLNLTTAAGDVGFPFSFQNIPLPHIDSGAQIAAHKLPSALPMPTLSTEAADYPKRVNALIATLASTSSQDRLSGRIGLAMLPPAGLPALEQAAARKDLPPSAASSIAAMNVKQKSWQNGQAKRDAALADAQAWQEKLARDTYARLGVHGAWDQKVVDAIHANFAWTERTDVVRVQAKFEDALAAGCDDPLVLGLAAYSFEQGGADAATIYSLYAKARDGMAARDYPAFFRIWNSIRYNRLVFDISTLDTRAKKLGFYPLADTQLFYTLHVDVRRIWPQAVHDGMPPLLLQKTAAQALIFMSNAGKDPEQISRAALDPLASMKPGEASILWAKGIFMVNSAWDARGSDTGDKVAPQAFALFRERLAEAESALTQACKLDPTNPDAAAEMINVCKGLEYPRQVMEGWYSKAMAADPSALYAVRCKLDYLSPMWHGSAAEITQFADECYRTENWRSGLPFIKATKHEDLIRGLDDAAAYYAAPEVWPEIKAVYEPYLLAVPDDVSARATYCAFACRTGQWTEAKRQFQVLGNHLPIRSFGFPDQLKQWQAAASSRGGTDQQ